MKKTAPDSKEPWPGWRLFSERNADSKHKCLLPNANGVICGEILTYRNTTSNFKNHLERVHPVVASELKANKDRLNNLALALPPGSPGQSKLSDFFDPGKVRASESIHKKYVDRLEHAVVEFIAGDIRPFHSVEGSSSTYSIFLKLCCLILLFYFH
jgi:hypothetical protein